MKKKTQFERIKFESINKTNEPNIDTNSFYNKNILLIYLMLNAFANDIQTFDDHLNCVTFVNRFDTVSTIDQTTYLRWTNTFGNHLSGYLDFFFHRFYISFAERFGTEYKRMKTKKKPSSTD